MKRFFTLFAGLLLVASGAFAQEKWKNVITNGNLEGEDFSCFKSQEVPNPGDERDIRDPRVVEDPLKAENHCIIIRARSAAEAEKESLDRYDTQFFVTSNGTEEIVPGKDLKISMRIRAEKDGHIGTQAHSAPGSYLGWNSFGEFDVTTTWKKYTLKMDNVTLEGLTTLALDLTTSTEENTFYFDDIKFEVRDHQDEPTGEESGWFNFLTNGTLSEMELSLPNGKFTNFTAREGAIASKGKGSEDHKARIIDDPIDGKPVLTAQSIGYNATHKTTTQVEAKDPETGETIIGEDGNAVMKDSIIITDIYIRENGDTVKKNDGSLGVEDWATQFFVSCPHEFKPGEKMRVKFQYRADKAASVDTQIHHGPGDYAFYQMLGTLDFTEEWQEFDQEVSVNTSSDAHGTTIAFNINKLKDVNNYYFRFEEFSANLSNVTIDDRTLKRNEVSLPVPTANNEVNIKVDMTPMIETLGIEDLTEFLNENTMKVLVREIIPGDEPDDDPEIKESLSGDLQATTGVFINANGSYVDEETGINITFPEEGIEGNMATINVFNLSGAVQAGEPIETIICFVKDDWFYTFDITLMTPDEYENVMGVTTIKAEKKSTGAIYDLTGRKINKPTKGFYIKDNKTFFIK